MSENLRVLEGKKVAFINLGCKVNSYETEAVRKSFIEAGAVSVPEQETADIYVINTCSVTNMADRKSRQMLHRARKNNPAAVIVATGCYVQAKGSGVLVEGDADIVVGNNDKHRVAEIIAQYLAGDRSGACTVEDIMDDRRYMDMSIDTFCEHSRAFIKVQDGCNQFCSYCIIPYTRGRVRSRSVEDTLAEVRSLSENGYKEVVLTGIHLSSYGITDYEKSRTISESDDPEQLMDYKPLLNLIEEVSKVPGVERIRLGSLEPRIICDDFVEKLSQIKSVCPQFHLSLQSGSDTVLKKMNRHYTMEEYVKKCEILRKWYDRPAITTDVIAGFPGETEELFEESIKAIEAVGFAKTHVFKYSMRQGTPAAKQVQVPDMAATARSERLIALDERRHLEYAGQFVGDNEEVLIERVVERDGAKFYTGLTMRYVEVFIPYDGRERTNEIMKVVVDGVTQGGELIAHER